MFNLTICLLPPTDQDLEIRAWPNRKEDFMSQPLIGELEISNEIKIKIISLKHV